MNYLTFTMNYPTFTKDNMRRWQADAIHRYAVYFMPGEHEDRHMAFVLFTNSEEVSCYDRQGITHDLNDESIISPSEIPDRYRAQFMLGMSKYINSTPCALRGMAAKQAMDKLIGCIAQ